jgi:hypothetical protein
VQIPPLRSDQLPNEDDGVQESISHIIPRGVNDVLIHKIFTNLWYIWKATNDYRFNHNKWTIAKVHYEAIADLQSAVLSFLADEEQ